jgi:RecA-family ATPase
MEEGARHKDMCDRSLQLIGNGLSREDCKEALDWLYPTGSGSHRKVSDQEKLDAIDGAIKRNPKPTRGSFKARNGNRYANRESEVCIEPYKHDGSREDIPQTEIALPYSKYLKDVLGFRDEECVCFASDMSRADLSGDAYFKQWDETTKVSDIEKVADECTGLGFTEHGSYYRVNPIKPGCKADSGNVSRFLYTVIEYDGIPREQQLAIYKRSGIPIRALVDTGGKSIHAIVKIDAPDLKEYERRVKLVRSYIGLGIDKTQDAVRYTRLPGSRYFKNGKKGKSRLIATDVGTSSWQEWESSIPIDDGLPDDVDLAEFLEVEIPEPEHLLKNFLRVGQVAIISGAAKTNKSWTMMEMALAISQGKGKFLKWEAYMGKVFYVDTELEVFDFQKRMKTIAKQLGIKDVDADDMRQMLIRGVRITLDELVPRLIRRLQGKNYKVIFIDAIYSVIGDRDENANGDISQIGALLFELAKGTGAAVVFSHHFSKGSQEGKRGIEKASGAGAWGRFPDVSLAIDHHAQAFCYNMEPTYRAFLDESPFVAERVNGVWKIRGDMRIEKKKNGQQVASVNDVLRVLEGEELTVSEWKTRCKDTLGISGPTFDRRKTEAREFIDEIKAGRKVTCRLKTGVKFDENAGRYVRSGKIEVSDGD